MAKAASNYFFIFLFNIFTISSSATLVGIAYSARGNTSTASLGLKPNDASSKQIRVYVADQRVLNLTSLSNSNASSVDLYLNLSLVVDLMQSELSAISWLETNMLTLNSNVSIRSIILSFSSEEFAGQNVLPLILSALKSFHSVLNRIHLDMKVKVSVAFPLPLLENLSSSHEGEINLIFGLIKKKGSFVIIEAGIDEEWRISDILVQSLIKKAIKATSVLPDSDVLIDFVIKSPLVPNAKQVAEYTETVSKFLENNIRIDELYADVASIGEFVQKELKMVGEKMISLSQIEVVNKLKTSIRDTTTIVTVPVTNPVTVTPSNPDSTPLPIPSSTPVNIPPATPVNQAAPITNPATTPTPVAVPVTPPATTNASEIQGRSWCVAKTGVSETALHQALDYACGVGGADCSLIQQGGSCYNPSSLQNHVSYAFNSYYQENPSPTTCDFGGTAMIVKTNPSTGSCVYPSSPSSSSSPPAASASTPPAQPASTTPPASDM